MISIDFRQKLHDAHKPIENIEELAGVDLDRLFLELADAAEDQRADVSVGTSDEIRALLLADVERLHGGLVPVGPSLRLAWNGKVRKYSLGVEPRDAEDGDAGRSLKLLSWSGTWPDVEFDMDLEVGTIREFFDALVSEVASIQMEAQAVTRIVEGDGYRPSEPPVLKHGTRIGNRLALAGLVTFLVPLAFWLAEAFSPDYDKMLLAGLTVGGLFFLASGLHNLRHAAETCGKEIRYSVGIWRVAAGAVMVAFPALVSVMTTTIYIAPDYYVFPSGNF